MVVADPKSVISLTGDASLTLAYHDRELLRLLPRVLRARDFHLYLEGGKRLTDLWLDGGRAILGHKPPRVVGELKNAAERGLFTPLPHPLERRFVKALGELFPERAFRLYADSHSLYRALTETGLTDVFVWRPFLEAPDGDGNEASALIPILPWPLGPEVLVIGKSLDASFPAGDLIPPVLLAPATRSLYDLLAAMKDKSRASSRYPKINKALTGALTEALRGQKPGTVSWHRRGIYMTLEPGSTSTRDNASFMDAVKEKYAELFQHFLEGGFLIPPSPEEPAILPSSMTDGEEAKLAKLLCGN